MVGAIAAGCPVLLKPAEATASVAALLADLVPKYLDPAAYAVVNGAVDETRALLDLRWAHIFFTGSTKVGRIVAAAAARHTTPLTLELGGNDPAIVLDDVDPKEIAQSVLLLQGVRHP